MQVSDESGVCINYLDKNMSGDGSSLIIFSFEYPKLTQANNVASNDFGTQMNIIRTHAVKTTTKATTPSGKQSRPNRVSADDVNLRASPLIIFQLKYPRPSARVGTGGVQIQVRG